MAEQTSLSSLCGVMKSNLETTRELLSDLKSSMADSYRDIQQSMEKSAQEIKQSFARILELLQEEINASESLDVDTSESNTEDIDASESTNAAFPVSGEIVPHMEPIEECSESINGDPKLLRIALWIHDVLISLPKQQMLSLVCETQSRGVRQNVTTELPPPKPPDTFNSAMDTIVLPSGVTIAVCTQSVWGNFCVNGGKIQGPSAPRYVSHNYFSDLGYFVPDFVDNHEAQKSYWLTGDLGGGQLKPNESNAKELVAFGTVSTMSVHVTLLFSSSYIHSCLRIALLIFDEMFNKTVSSSNSQFILICLFALQQHLHKLAGSIEKKVPVVALIVFKEILQQLAELALEPYWVHFLSYVNGPSHDDGAGIVGFIFLCVTIAIVAEGLPLSMTLNLAFSTKKLLHDQRMVYQLAICETMDPATAICIIEQVYKQHYLDLHAGFFSVFGSSVLLESLELLDSSPSLESNVWKKIAVGVAQGLTYPFDDSTHVLLALNLHTGLIFGCKYFTTLYAYGKRRKCGYAIRVLKVLVPVHCLMFIGQLTTNILIGPIVQHLYPIGLLTQSTIDGVTEYSNKIEWAFHAIFNDSHGRFAVEFVNDTLHDSFGCYVNMLYLVMAPYSIKIFVNVDLRDSFLSSKFPQYQLNQRTLVPPKWPRRKSKDIFDCNGQDEPSIEDKLSNICTAAMSILILWLDCVQLFLAIPCACLASHYVILKIVDRQSILNPDTACKLTMFQYDPIGWLLVACNIRLQSANGLYVDMYTCKSEDMQQVMSATNMQVGESSNLFPRYLFNDDQMALNNLLNFLVQIIPYNSSNGIRVIILFGMRRVCLPWGPFIHMSLSSNDFIATSTLRTRLLLKGKVL